ncbi:MAG: DNA polymerase IV [Rhodobacterales bacterium]|nr:DNA polymerase IV [Rhodobacterales bacterium]
MEAGLAVLCRDCGWEEGAREGHGRCPSCGGERLLSHPELADLGIAHIDCDAFYATIEKRDDPSLADQPVIVGGGTRGVVSAACYLARRHGVHSAMPMFKARRLCPQAVVIPPHMDKYAAEGRRVRDLMRDVTPLVEPLSIDEAFLDLRGTERLHHGSPARTLALLIRRIEAEVGITASVGLAPNKFLAKIASDLDKPRGFAVIGRAQALDFLAGQPVSIIWGVGAVLRRKLEGDGLRTVGQLRALDRATLERRYGAMGARLYHLSRAQDDRAVEPSGQAKSLSAETTFDTDISDGAEMGRLLWRLSEKVARRLRAADLSGATVTLKLKTADFRILTRSRTLTAPTRLADAIYGAARPLLDREANGRRFRLIGVGVGKLEPGAGGGGPDLLAPGPGPGARVAEAMDRIRDRFGDGAIIKGRGLPHGPEREG